MADAHPVIRNAVLSRRRIGAVVALALAGFVVGCGGGAAPTAVEGTTSSSAPTDVAAPSPAPAPSPTRKSLPSVVVNDVTGGSKVNLASVPPPDRPLLIWFWAPH